jgi:hypothetical protein
LCPGHPIGKKQAAKKKKTKIKHKMVVPFVFFPVKIKSMEGTTEDQGSE